MPSQELLLCLAITQRVFVVTEVSPEGGSNGFLNGKHSKHEVWDDLGAGMEGEDSVASK